MTNWIADTGTEYEVWLSRYDGSRLGVIDTFVSMEYAKVANDIGAFSIILPQTFNYSLLDKDRLISIWRRPSGGMKYLDFRGPVLHIFEREESNGAYQITIYGASMTQALERRTIAYNAGLSQTEKTAKIDNMMKAIMRENLGSLVTDANRDMTSDGLLVQPDLGLGPTQERAFAYKNVLQTLKDLNSISRTAGVEVFFSIEPVSSSSFQFNTYIGQPGSDLRGKFVFSREFGNLGWAQFDQDWSQFGNFVYAMGAGDGISREVVTTYLTPKVPKGFDRTEVTRDARNDGFTAGVTAAAMSEAQQARAIKHFQGEALSVPGSIYGLDWHFGDYVNASFRGRQFDCIIRAVTVALDQNRVETISALLESYTT